MRIKRKFKSKHKKGERFVIEIAEVHTHYSDEGTPYSVYRIKGFNSLMMDDYGLDRVIKLKEHELDVAGDLIYTFIGQLGAMAEKNWCPAQVDMLERLVGAVLHGVNYEDWSKDDDSRDSKQTE